MKRCCNPPDHTDRLSAHDAIPHRLSHKNQTRLLALVDHPAWPATFSGWGRDTLQRSNYDFNYVWSQADNKLLIALRGKFVLSSQSEEHGGCSYGGQVEGETRNLHKSLSNCPQPFNDPVWSLLGESAMRVLVNESNCHVTVITSMGCAEEGGWDLWEDIGIVWPYSTFSRPTGRRALCNVNDS